MQNQFIYQDCQIIIERKVIKHAYMRVKPDGSVLMTVNKRLTHQQIQDILEKTFPKLKNKITETQKNQQIRIQNKNTVYYLGNKYQVLINYSCDKKDIYLLNNQLHINTNSAEEYSINEINKLIDNWYKKEANKVFKLRFDAWCLKIENWGVLKPSLAIRALKSRFGSYNKAQHKVTLSLSLIKAPINLIDYVIAHELSHIKHFNHSSHFYNEMAKLYPNWANAKKELNSLASIY